MRRRLDDGKNVHGPGQERKARGSEVRLTADIEITEEEERETATCDEKRFGHRERSEVGAGYRSPTPHSGGFKLMSTA